MERLIKGQALSSGEKKWLASAVREEVTHLNRFLEDIKNDRLRMPLRRRLEMYVDTLRGAYDAGRVIGTPKTTVIHWFTRKDRKVCPGCQWMEEMSPFVKWSLPTTPRAGNTPCLSRCRCRVLMRPADQKTYLETVNVHRRAQDARSGPRAASRTLPGGDRSSCAPRGGLRGEE